MKDYIVASIVGGPFWAACVYVIWRHAELSHMLSNAFKTIRYRKYHDAQFDAASEFYGAIKKFSWRIEVLAQHQIKIINNNKQGTKDDIESLESYIDEFKKQLKEMEDCMPLISLFEDEKFELIRKEAEDEMSKFLMVIKKPPSDYDDIDKEPLIEALNRLKEITREMIEP